MKQYVKLFIGFSESVDAQINEFLNKHLNYTINKITFDGSSSDRVLVVFNVKEPPRYGVADGGCPSTSNKPSFSRIPEFENAKSIDDCTRCKIRNFCIDLADGGFHTCQEVYRIYLQSKENN